MSNVGDPAVYAKVIVPDNANDMPTNARSIYVGVTGDIQVTTIGGDIVVFRNVPVGVLPVQVKRVWVTNTTATLMVALQ